MTHTPAPTNPAQVTDAMVEAAAKELLAHGGFSSIPGNNEPNALIAARAALTAAIGAGGQAVAWQRRKLYEPTEQLWEQCSKDEATGHFERQPGYEYRPLYTHPAPSGQAVAVKPLDLSNLLKHAFSAGYVSAAGDDGWTDYDPTKCAAYSRILSAIAHPVQPGWRDITEDALPPFDKDVILAYWQDWPRKRWCVEVGFYGSKKGGWIHSSATHWMPVDTLPAAPQPKGE